MHRTRLVAAAEVAGACLIGIISGIYIFQPGLEELARQRREGGRNAKVPVSDPAPPQPTHQ
jgi:hypothetical protein